MKWIRTLLAIITLLVAFVLSVLAVRQPEVALNFVYWQTPFAISVFWWLLIAFVLGILLGVINTAWVATKHRLANRRLQRELAQQQAEIERLQGAVAPIAGSAAGSANP